MDIEMLCKINFCLKILITIHIIFLRIYIILIIIIRNLSKILFSLNYQNQ